MTIKRVTKAMQPDTDPAVLTVSQLTALVRDALQDVGDLTVSGEVSQWKVATSGHTYFTLKDESAVISAVLWKGRGAGRAPIRDGMSVVATGKLTVYPPRGSYQLDCATITPLGRGDLQIAFEQLKAKLLGLGLFDQSRKRPLPWFPRRVGIVTSRTGAVIHDMVTVMRRRMPSVRVVLRAAQVQGAGAAQDIAAGIAELNALADVDVIIVGRGGGSLEDLWAFNEEAVAKAIAGSGVPVVSAVGHETDYTIADFVADMRAPTPTAAAAMVIPDAEDILESLYQSAERMGAGAEDVLADRARQLERLAGSRGMARPADIVRAGQQRLDDLEHRTHMAVRAALRGAGDRLAVAQASLRALNPVNVLKRGFAIIEKDAAPVKGVAELRQGDRITVRMHDGERGADIAD